MYAKRENVQGIASIRTRLESAAAIRVVGLRRPGGGGMSLCRVFIHRLRGLRAAVSVCDIEIQRADAVRAGDTLECDSAVHRFGCVVSHTVIVAANSRKPSSIRCATFG